MKVNHEQFRWWCSYWPELCWCCYLRYTSTEVSHSIWVFKLHFPLPFPSRKNKVDHSLLMFFIPKYWCQESVFLLRWQIPNRNNSKGGNIVFYGFRSHSWRSAAFTVSGPVVRKHIMAEGHPGGELSLFWWPRNSRQSCTLEQNRVPKGKVLGTYFLQLEPTSKSFHKIMNLLLD